MTNKEAIKEGINNDTSSIQQLEKIIVSNFGSYMKRWRTRYLSYNLINSNNSNDLLVDIKSFIDSCLNYTNSYRV
jgi:hypothetical protein